jgi:hypothetical protein
MELKLWHQLHRYELQRASAGDGEDSGQHALRSLDSALRRPDVSGVPRCSAKDSDLRAPVATADNRLEA